MAHGSTLKKKTSKDDPYGWMSDVFQGIFKEGEKKKVEVHKNGTFKINSNKRKKKRKCYNKFSSQRKTQGFDLFPTVPKKEEEKKMARISQFNLETNMKDDAENVAIQAKTETNQSKDEPQKQVTEDVQKEPISNVD